MTLLDECIEALGTEGQVKNAEETKKILKDIQSEVDFTRWGRVNWTIYPSSFHLNSAKDIIPIAEKINANLDDFYIFWDNASVPVIKSKLFKIIDVIDDVTAVAFDTWLYNFEHKIIIEFHHEGEIVL